MGLLRSPNGVATDSAGNLYIADTGNHRVRKVDSTGTITTVAGTGEIGFSGDAGPATLARLWGPDGVATDDAGNLYISDTGNRRIRKIDPLGTITTFAGSGLLSDSGDDGLATSASLWPPSGVATDSAGNLFIVEPGNHRIRKVDSSGTITTFAGSGVLGDGGPATLARLDSPRGVAVDNAGNLYIAERGDHWIRKVDSTGTITYVAGYGERGFSGDGGPAVNAQLASPYGVAVDDAGNLFIADSGNNRIRKVDSSGAITTVAGTGELGFGGDGGRSVEAQLYNPFGLALDDAGNLYIADIGNHRIRVLTSFTDSGGEHAPLLEGIRDLLPF